MNLASQIRLPNAEIRRNAEIRKTKSANAQPRPFRYSGFGFPSSFVICHSSFRLARPRGPNSCAVELESILQPFLRRPFRVTGRVAWLIAEFVLGTLAYVVQVAFRQGNSRPVVRGRWLQHTCRRVLRVFGVKLDVSGPVPARGLLVCNHLSYLDILLIGAVAPALFVAKHEVRRWPVIGSLARLAGTIFVQRNRRIDAGRATAKIADALDHGALVVLFPEGTSSGGETVLPFKSALLSPATRQERPLSAGYIRYAIEEGSVSEEVCYWREMTLLPHLLNLLGKQGVSAQVSFTQLQHRSPDRKELARQLHGEVIRLKEQSMGALTTSRDVENSIGAAEGR